MASALRDVSVGEIERRLEEVRENEEPTQRTSVLTHMAWVPPEWTGLARAYVRLAELFDRIVVSDLAWARTLRWRAGLADLWPEIKRSRVLHVVGPRAEALLLRGWLRSRLGRDFRLRHDDAD